MTERGDTGGFEARYDLIDAANARSWYMTGARRFEVYQSVGMLKPSARLFGEHAVRQTLAGNMSPIYGPEDEARGNMLNFYASVGLHPGDMVGTVLLKPQRQYDIPLQAIEADDYSRKYISDARPATAGERADFLYTYDPSTVLAARPADCPIVLAEAQTPRGRILTLTHFAWQGAASGFVDQMFDRYDELDIDRDSLRIYMTPGGQAESFPYTADYDPRGRYPGSDGLFVDVRETDGKFGFSIDTPHYVYGELLKHGVRSDQIFADISDTSRLDSGYSSHGRAARSHGEERNIRDIIVAKMNDVILNPDNPAPREIAETITSLDVAYFGFDGERHEGTIEVARDVWRDVRDFFHVAYETRFPIGNVTRASDDAFGWQDGRLMDANVSSGFNYRVIAGTDRPSLHARGRAFDVNPRLNPYVGHAGGATRVIPEGAFYDPSAPGTLTPDHPLVRFMTDRGWEWGGNWTPESGRTDYQHFQKAD